MSLIDEALRRARQEAARQDAVQREARYRQVPVLPPTTRQRSSRPVLIGAAVALCVAAGIGIGVYLGKGETAKEEPAAAPAAVAPIETPVPESSPEPVVPAPSPAPVEPQSVPVTSREPLSPPPALDPATPPPVTVQPVPEPTPAPAPAPPENPVRTYIREVPLPDGGTLRLNGIAFSAAQPVALIDDRVFAKGESYKGFTVTDIQPGVVELTGNGMTVRVSLK